MHEDSEKTDSENRTIVRAEAMKQLLFQEAKARSSVCVCVCTNPVCACMSGSKHTLTQQHAQACAVSGVEGVHL